MNRLAIDLQRSADQLSWFIHLGTLTCALLGWFVNPWFYIGAIVLFPTLVIHFYFRRIQIKHTILRNFGFLGSFRYILESVGPELRQYFFLSDNEERPFNRAERAEVYRKAKDIDSSEAFGSLKEFDHHETKIRHAMFPINKEDLIPFQLTFGEERNIANTYTITKPMMISAMSFGSLGANAIRALSHGAKQEGIPMNTGEGGLSPYHLEGSCDIIFQMGTAKFGVRNEDGTLNDKKLQNIVKHKQVKMIEIKFSQGAKPGKGGLLPKEKITEEIAKIRHVPMDRDVISPPRHKECDNPENTVKFIKHVQDTSNLPVGVKMCLGSENDFIEFVREMKRQGIYPDYISIDGAEGGTGASPKSFMDYMGVPLFPALNFVHETLKKEGIRDKLKLVAAGKLISPGKQILAFSHGADAVYTARGFMLALGCIQALQCNKGTCPVGITTHDKRLQKGLIVKDKAKRVANYVKNCEKEFKELLSAAGARSVKELNRDKVYIPQHHM